MWILDREIRVEIDKAAVDELRPFKEKDLGILIKKNLGEGKEDNNENRTGVFKINLEEVPENNKGKPEKSGDKRESLDRKAEDKDEKFASFVEDLEVNPPRHFYLYGHSSAVFSLSISNDIQHIISGSFDGTIRLWNLHLKSCFAIFQGHFAPVFSVKFSPFSHYFASGGADKVARLWAVNSSCALRVFRKSLIEP